MSNAIDMDAEQRADLARDVEEVAVSRTPRIWLDEQISAASPEIETG